MLQHSLSSPPMTKLLSGRRKQAQLPVPICRCCCREGAAASTASCALSHAGLEVASPAMKAAFGGDSRARQAEPGS